MTSHTIKLLEVCGKFCARRTHAKLDFLRQEAEKAIRQDQIIVFDRAGVKILTPSFLDELLVELAIKHGSQKVKTLVKFIPPLEPFLEEQLERGLRLRR